MASFRAADGSGPALRLVGSVPLQVEAGRNGDAGVAAFTLCAGEGADFVLLGADQASPGPGETEALFRACVAH